MGSEEDRCIGGDRTDPKEIVGLLSPEFLEERPRPTLPL